MAREYYSIPEVAALLGVSRIAVFKRVKKGQLPALRIGRNWAVPAAVLLSAVPSSIPSPGPGRSNPDKKSVAIPLSSSDAEMDSIGWD
jgi:excisionase family DNA binding protein